MGGVVTDADLVRLQNSILKMEDDLFSPEWKVALTASWNSFRSKAMKKSA
jgi:hypothetical protein